MQINNESIGDDTKAAARRSLNVIKKTKKYVLWSARICLIIELRSKLDFPPNLTEIGG